VEITSIAGWFWIAIADARFDTVTVTHQGTRERRRIRQTRW
jgi:hypothetical protein